MKRPSRGALAVLATSALVGAPRLRRYAAAYSVQRWTRDDEVSASGRPPTHDQREEAARLAGDLFALSLIDEDELGTTVQAIFSALAQADLRDAVRVLHHAVIGRSIA